MGDSPNTNANDRDPFYVGYLPLLASIKRFIVPWLVGNLVLAIGISVVLASNHREPGDGTWDLNKAVTIQGELSVDPYPLLRSKGKTYILVEQGKIGVQDRIKSEKIPVGKISATGFLIKRDGRTVLEIDGTIDKPIERLRDGKPASSTVSAIDLEEVSRQINAGLSLDLGTHTLRGEIVDPKCYLGVMQPGDGKTHKVCATLCISGGIPPMLLVRDKQGNTAAYLLTDAEGKAFPESHYQYIADPIELTGQVLRDGDLLILRADLGSIRRLGADH